jgi:hypothetical protein
LLTRREPVQFMAELTLIIIDLAAGPREAHRHGTACPAGTIFQLAWTLVGLRLAILLACLCRQGHTFCHRKARLLSPPSSRTSPSPRGTWHLALGTWSRRAAQTDRQTERWAHGAMGAYRSHLCRARPFPWFQTPNTSSRWLAIALGRLVLMEMTWK